MGRKWCEVCSLHIGCENQSVPIYERHGWWSYQIPVTHRIIMEKILKGTTFHYYLCQKNTLLIVVVCQNSQFHIAKFGLLCHFSYPNCMVGLYSVPWLPTRSYPYHSLKQTLYQHRIETIRPYHRSHKTPSVEHVAEP